MAVTVNGPWTIRVVLKNAGWNQRYVISGSNASNGAYPGNIGSQITVAGTAWNIQAQANGGSGWLDSDMRIGPETQSGISVIRLVETNDAGGSDLDFDDLVLELRKKQDPVLEIIQRPYSIDRATAMVNPDGVFLAGGGVQIMGIRVRNTWTHPMPADQAVEISDLGRMQLAAAGITVVDSWTANELATFGQEMVGPVVVLGALDIGAERTIYFKLDFSGARASTPEVEIICHRVYGPEHDMDDPARLARRKFFVTEVRYDPVTRQVEARVPEGRLLLQLTKLTLDPRAWNHARDCIRSAARANRGGTRNLRDALLGMLRDLEKGRCDPCALQKLIALYCQCVDGGGKGPGGGGRPGGDGGGGDGRVNPCPFPWFPLQFTMVVEAPFDGQHGPLPFQDPWWKILFAIIAILLLIAAALVDILDEAHENPEIVIGTVDTFSTANVDCALVRLNGSRSFDLGVLDAQTGEPNLNTRIALDAVVPIVRSVATPFVGMRVYKSGARTGFTHGLVTSITATTNQCRGTWDDATSSCTPDPARPNLVMTNQIRIGTDPAFPGEPTTDNGDSGSLWLSDEPATRDQVVALTHSGSTTSDANPITDVLGALNVRLNP